MQLLPALAGTPLKWAQQSKKSQSSFVTIVILSTHASKNSFIQPHVLKKSIRKSVSNSVIMPVRLSPSFIFPFTAIAAGIPNIS